MHCDVCSHCRDRGACCSFSVTKRQKVLTFTLIRHRCNVKTGGIPRGHPRPRSPQSFVMTFRRYPVIFSKWECFWMLRMACYYNGKILFIGLISRGSNNDMGALFNVWQRAGHVYLSDLPLSKDNMSHCIWTDCVTATWCCMQIIESGTCENKCFCTFREKLLFIIIHFFTQKNTSEISDKWYFLHIYTHSLCLTTQV